MEPRDGPEPNASRAQQSFVWGKSAWGLSGTPPPPPSPSLPGLSWEEPESPVEALAASAGPRREAGRTVCA